MIRSIYFDTFGAQTTIHVMKFHWHTRINKILFYNVWARNLVVLLETVLLNAFTFVSFFSVQNIKRDCRLILSFLEVGIKVLSIATTHALETRKF